MSVVRGVELFAGAGGMGLGAHRAGVHVVRAYEVDEDARTTHAQNLDVDVWHRRVTSKMGIPPCDILFGGPPCQPFSSLGFKRGADDPRDGLSAMITIALRHQPRAVVIENVRGLTFKRHLAYLDAQLERLRFAGYDVHHRILCAADYGVPQRRERLFIVALERGCAWEWPAPTHSSAALREALHGAASCDAPYVCPVHDERQLRRAYGDPKARPWVAVRDCIPDAVAMYVTAGKGRRRWMDARCVAPTVPGHGRDARVPVRLRNGRVLDDYLDMNAMWQAFPRQWKWCGSRTSIARQIGNAVPPPLAEAVLGSVVPALTAEGS